MENIKNFQSSELRSTEQMREQISHELRTPLTGILGMAHFLEKTSLTAEQKDYLQDIVTSAHHLLEVENKLLAFLKNNQSST